MSNGMVPNNRSSFSTGNRQSPSPRGILYIVSAPSGAGKTTLCKQIVSSVPRIWHSVSFTTRRPRPGEEHGRDYFFVDETVFQGMIEQKEFLEYAHVYNHWYGTPRKPLVHKIEEGVDVLLEIDVQGALQIKKSFEDAISVFILPPSLDILRTRLLNRGSDSEEEIAHRMRKVKEEVLRFREYDYIVRNDDLTQSFHELESIFLAERLKVNRLDMRWFEQGFILDEKMEEPSTTS